MPCRLAKCTPRRANSGSGSRLRTGNQSAMRLSWGACVGLLVCCGCALVGHERPVPKQLAQSRQASQRGISALDRGDWDKGEALLAEAIQLCPLDPEPHRHYAEALWHRGAKEQALAEMQEAARLSGDNPALAVRTGEMCLDMGRIADCDRLADQAVVLDPRMGAAWALRGEVALNEGRLDDALADLHRRSAFSATTNAHCY